MKNYLLPYLAGAVLACSSAGAYAQADHLLLSELSLNSVTEGAGNSSEFVEIFNPTPNAISLSNYYLSDSNNYTSLTVALDGKVDVGPSDNIVRFPAGTTLASNQVAVVTYTGSAFLTDHFGGDIAAFNALTGDPLLFEVTESDAAIDNMLILNTPQVPENGFDPVSNFSRTNGGEFLLMFHWDGASNLVDDVDIVAWGLPGATSTNRFQPKDANRTGKNGTPYLVDAGSHANLTIDPATAIVTRNSITEASETPTGGNGITNHDESTEQVSTGWAGGAIGNATPGLTGLTAVGANQTPLVNSAERNIQYPTSSDSILITANATDGDGTIASVRVFVNSGSGFAPVTATNTGGSTYTATIGPFADDTVIQYYVEATDNDGGLGYLPELAPAEFRTFIVDNTPVQEGDVVINEILYDHPGGDTYEFVELYNTQNTALNLSEIKFADSNRSYFTLPQGASIPANGYMILSLDPAAMEIQYLPVAGVQYYDWGTFVLNNGGDDLVLAHPNALDFNGATTFLDQVVYSSTAPWPEINGNATGKSIELLNPALDNSLPASWAGAEALGTPGQQNSVFSEAPGITNVTRTQEFPAPSTPINISATVTATGSGTIAAVRIFVNTGSGFVATPMTLSSTPGVYSVTLPGYPEGTIVRYYIEAEGGTGQKSTQPFDGAADPYIFLVNANPATAADIVINEILYNNIGGDSYEYIELYNRRNTPIPLPLFRVGDGSSAFFTFPEEAVIPGNGFIVLSLDPAALSINYIVPAGVPVYDWGEFVLNNGGDLVYIAHPNSINFNGTTTNLDEVNYLTVDPWPVINSETTGQSIELLSPELDNSLGDNWAGSVPVGDGIPGSGTPGKTNTAVQSSVSDWTLY